MVVTDARGRAPAGRARRTCSRRAVCSDFGGTSASISCPLVTTTLPCASRTARARAAACARTGVDDHAHLALRDEEHPASAPSRAPHRIRPCARERDLGETRVERRAEIRRERVRREPARRVGRSAAAELEPAGTEHGDESEGEDQGPLHARVIDAAAVGSDHSIEGDRRWRPGNARRWRVEVPPARRGAPERGSRQLRSPHGRPSCVAPRTNGLTGARR